MVRLIPESEADSSPTTPRLLAYSRGDLIVALTPDPAQDLVLHADLLSTLSPHFIGVTKEAWSPHAKTVTDSSIRQDVRVHTYYLYYNSDLEDVVTLDTTPPTDRGNIDEYLEHRSARVFYQSDTADGFFARSEGSPFKNGPAILDDARKELRTIFGLLYKEDVDLAALDYENIANVIARAEMYDLLPYIAPALRSHLLSRTDIWEDVRDEYKFHLSIAIKLRCPELYADALRHYIGNGDDIADLTTQLRLEAKDVLPISFKREKLNKRTAKLTADIQSFTLATYIPHSDRSTPGKPVKTTYLASSKELSFFDKVEQIARHIFTDWFVHQLTGDEHWSHVREYGDYPSGVYSKSSLRNACNLATQAVETNSELELFGPDAVKTYVADASASLERDAYTTHYVEDCLKKMVYNMAKLALPLIAPPEFKPTKPCSAVDKEITTPNGTFWDVEAEDWEPIRVGPARHAGNRVRGRARGRARFAPHRMGGEVRLSRSDDEKRFEREGMTAKCDEDCHYFTCVDVEEFPWKEDFEAYKLEGFQRAREEWLEAVGAVAEDESEEDD